MLLSRRRILGIGAAVLSPVVVPSDALQYLQDRLPDDRRLPHSGDGRYIRFDGED